MASTAISDHDQRTGYCRMLGHHLTFAYCRTGAEGRPCPKILDCWFETFDVLGFVSRYHPEALDQRHPPKAKVTTLMALIQEAQRRSA